MKKWHKLFNRKNFSYNTESKLIKDKINYKKFSYSLLKVIHPELDQKKFNNIIKYITKNLILKKNKSILDFGSGNGAFLFYFTKKYRLKKNLSFEISQPLLNLQKKFIDKTKFFKTHHNNTKLYKKYNNKIVDYAMCISVFQYFYNKQYFLDTLDFLIRVSKKKILIYDLKYLNKKKLYKEIVRKRQKLSKIEFRKKYKDTPIRFYSKKFVKKTLNQLQNKHNFSFKFLKLPIGATDNRFGYSLLITKNDYIKSKNLK